jgi:hypothetical protein
MKTTILVSVREIHEQPVELLTVELANQQAELSAGMPTDQAYELLEHLQPLLEKNRLAHYDEIRLTYFVEGVPKFEESWYRTPSWVKGETAMPTGPGHKLYRMPVTDVTLEHVTL